MLNSCPPSQLLLCRPIIQFSGVSDGGDGIRMPNIEALRHPDRGMPAEQSYPPQVPAAPSIHRIHPTPIPVVEGCSPAFVVLEFRYQNRRMSKTPPSLSSISIVSQKSAKPLAGHSTFYTLLPPAVLGRLCRNVSEPFMRLRRLWPVTTRV